MADSVTTFAIDSTQVYLVIANTYCYRVTVQENFDSANPPTQDLRMYGNPTRSTPVRVPKGTPAVFTKGGAYFPGEIVGGINTSAGAVTVQQIESSQV